MAPSAQRDGEIIGFKKGFKFEESDWLKDFQKSEWNNFEHEKKLNKERFQIAYLEEYEKGKYQRQKIQKELQLQLGIISNQEKEIQDKYLNQVFDSFYGASFLFKSWEERIDKEIFPKNESIKSIEELRDEAVNLIESKRHQKALQYLKEFFLKKKNSEFYHKSLKVDTELQNLRLKSKLKKVNKEEYKGKLLIIESQLFTIKKKIEK